MHTSLNGMYIYSFTENKNIYINEEYTNITGYTLEDLEIIYKENFMSLFHRNDHESVSEHMNDVASSENNEVFDLKYRFRHKTGKHIWCLSRDVISKRDENGKPLEMIGTFLDMTAFHDECD